MQMIKFIFLFAMLSVMILGATNLVIKVTKGVFEASARQPEKADTFLQRALTYIGFGDVFIGVAAAVVLPMIVKDPAVDVETLLEKAESFYQTYEDQTHADNANTTQILPKNSNN